MSQEEKEFEIEDTNIINVIIKLASTNKARLETVCREFYTFASDSHDVKMEKLPTATATITTRKSPCGEGTNTWARYKMHVSQRMFEVSVGQNMLARMADYLKKSNVEVTLTIKN